MIDSGQAKNESDLARQIGISRVRVNQFIQLLKLDREVREAVEQLGDPVSGRIVTERILRPYIKTPPEKQGEFIQNLLARKRYI